MNPQWAAQVNQWIDVLHNPRYWIIFWLVAVYVVIEDTFIVRSDIPFRRIQFGWRFSILVFTWLILASQSIFGGCAIQFVQNYLAREYLDRDYWYPFGLVFREFLSPQYWILLRGLYLVLTVAYGAFIYHYWNKRRTTRVKKEKPGSTFEVTRGK